ncbi:MAG: urease accessory protein UreE [Verrucomicrobiales bacterium]
MDAGAVTVRRALAEASSLPPEARVVIGVHRRMFLKRKWEVVAPDGTSFQFDLESRLPDGGVVHHAGGRDYIVCQLMEKVYEIPFDTPELGAEIAWKIGNMHLPAEMFSRAVRVLHDPMTLDLLNAEGWNFTEPEVLFRPLKNPPHQTASS